MNQSLASANGVLIFYNLSGSIPLENILLIFMAYPTKPLYLNYQRPVCLLLPVSLLS